MDKELTVTQPSLSLGAGHDGHTVTQGALPAQHSPSGRNPHSPGCVLLLYRLIGTRQVKKRSFRPCPTGTFLEQVQYCWIYLLFAGWLRYYHTDMGDDLTFPPSPRRPRRAVPVDPAQAEIPVAHDARHPGGGKFSHSSREDFSAWKSLSSVIGVALVVATLFTLWTPANLFSNELLERMFQAVQPPVQEQTPLTPRHRPAAVGLVGRALGERFWFGLFRRVTEDGHLKIATLVQRILPRRISVDLLKSSTRAAPSLSVALVSIITTPAIHHAKRRVKVPRRLNGLS